MSAHSFTESELLRASFAGRVQRMLDSERRAALIVGGSFLLAALAVALLGVQQHKLSLSVAALYVVGIAAASEVRFEIGAGFTVPTQAVFVPMLFAVPAPIVPLLVACGLALALVPSILRGHVAISRLLTVPGNSWFALGPSLVLVLAHDRSPDGHWGVLIIALLAQGACDIGSSAAWERLRGGLTFSQLTAELRQVYLIDLTLAPLGLVVAIAAIRHPWAVVLIAPLFGVLRWFSKERRARLDQLIELNDAYRGDDTYTGEHCKDVVHLALDVARELGLGAEEQRTVEFGALLHDIGKIAVPKAIVNKPGKLDPHEWEIIKTHTVEGQRMLERVGGFMGKVGRIVRSHHERWDGGGYPDGLRGEDIALEARIICCCDAFNAMTTTRPYRKAMPVSAALSELAKHAGTQFDPRVVDALSTLVCRTSDPRSETANVGALAPAHAEH
ncbi:MAG: HD-GYP domain-containing protein [Solirubrobacteraceae bacterium]